MMTETICHWDPDKGDLCQGDVLLFRPPETFTLGTSDRIRPCGGKLTLAKGELTGHHHAIWFNPPMFRDNDLARPMEAQCQSAPAALYRDSDLVSCLVEHGLLTDASLCVGFLVVETPVQLRHQEHDAVHSRRASIMSAASVNSRSAKCAASATDG
jgi:hypothetical protein